MKSKMSSFLNRSISLLFFLTCFVQAQEVEDKHEKARKGLFYALNETHTGANFNFSKLKSAMDYKIEEAILQLNAGGEWENLLKYEYSYSEDRLTITQELYSYNSEDEEWVASSTNLVTSFTSDGLPLSLYSGDGDEYLDQEFFYSSEGKLDSVIITELFEGEIYLDKIELFHASEDSIQLINTYEYPEDSGVIDTDYILIRDGNVVEVYDTDTFLDRYTYYELTFDEYLIGNTSDFFFTDILNDTFYEGEGWIPYNRITYSREEGVVTQGLEEEYLAEEWTDKYIYLFDYEDQNIVTETQGTRYGEEWAYESRILYTYEASTNTEPAEKVPGFSLSQNYPNPFNPSTTISFNLNAPGFVSLKIFNVLGKEVATLVSGFRVAGGHSEHFNASSLPSGLYYYTIKTAEFTQTKAMTLIK